MSNAFTANGLFGSLFRDDEVAGLFAGPAFLARMLEFEAAWTRALAEVGAVAEAQASTALAVIEAGDVPVGALGTASDRDGLPVPALVAELKSRAGEAAAGAIHTGATSQDVIDTAMVMTLREVSLILAARLDTAIKAIDTLCAAHGEAPLTGRTRMQAALPIRAIDRLRTWRLGMTTALDDLAPLRSKVERVQVGGPVGLRDTPGGQGPRMAEIVGRSLGLASGPVWHTERSAMTAYGAWLVQVAGALGKIGQDVALMAQQGVDEIALEAGGGSSAMPHKQNPVLAETLVTLARFTAGQQGVLAQTLIHEQERSGAAWALEWLTLPAMAEATGTALRHTTTLLGRITRIGTP